MLCAQVVIAATLANVGLFQFGVGIDGFWQSCETVIISVSVGSCGKCMLCVDHFYLLLYSFIDVQLNCTTAKSWKTFSLNQALHLQGFGE